MSEQTSKYFRCTKEEYAAFDICARKTIRNIMCSLKTGVGHLEIRNISCVPGKVRETRFLIAKSDNIGVEQTIVDPLGKTTKTLLIYSLVENSLVMSMTDHIFEELGRPKDRGGLIGWRSMNENEYERLRNKQCSNTHEDCVKIEGVLNTKGYIIADVTTEDKYDAVLSIVEHIFLIRVSELAADLPRDTRYMYERSIFSFITSTLIDIRHISRFIAKNKDEASPGHIYDAEWFLTKNMNSDPEQSNVSDSEVDLFEE